MVTTVALGPSRCANRIAATTFAPEDAPANKPSSRANQRAMAFASLVETGMISLTSFGSQSGGMKPTPVLSSNEYFLITTLILFLSYQPCIRNLKI
jgi:hypothetical protein